jgi:hypothetical protein
MEVYEVPQGASKVRQQRKRRPGESPVLAQRAVSEDPRWTRAVGDSSGPSSRMLKKSSSGVLASLRGSPYGTEYDSTLRSLRPCWTAFLSILHGGSASS